jgi:hypothetical protein
MTSRMKSRMTSRRAVALVASLSVALGGCAGAQAPQASPLSVSTSPPQSIQPAASPLPSASEAPDVDSPDETADAGSPSPTSPGSPKPAAGDGITGTWDGVWQNDPQWGDAHGGFRMTVTQDGISFEGPIDVTGPTCIRHGLSRGTVTGSHVSMGWIATGIRDVAFEGTLAGATMSGTWTATACKANVDISGTWSAQRE